MPPLHVGTRFALGWALTLTPGPGFFSFAKAQDQNQRNVDAAITGAERICLSGSRYSFALKANGDLTIKKLSPGAEVELKVDRNETRGGTFFDDAQVRQVVDQDIRACMKSEWPKVIRALTAGGDQSFSPPGFAPQHAPPPLYQLPPRPWQHTSDPRVITSACDHGDRSACTALAESARVGCSMGNQDKCALAEHMAGLGYRLQPR